MTWQKLFCHGLLRSRSFRNRRTKSVPPCLRQLIEQKGAELMAATTPSVERAGNVARSGAALDFLKASPKKLLIGGKWVAAEIRQDFRDASTRPPRKSLRWLAEGDKADVDEAVKAARKAFEEGKWSKIGPASARPLSAQDRRPDRPACGRAGRARKRWTTARR